MDYSRIGRLQPETRAGGFTAQDGTVAFYVRVDALLEPTMTVLDLGAGRAAWFHDDPCRQRRKLRDFRGRAERVIGCDVDPEVRTNPTVHEAHLFDPQGPVPLPDGSVDIIIADYVMEHIEEPERFAAEIERLLTPGGWFCARTPSKYHYVSLISMMLPSRLNDMAIARAQPKRKQKDVFPAFYRLNTLGTVGRWFPPERFTNASYWFKFEPQYHFGKPFIYRIFQVVNAVLPASMAGNLFVFLQKTPAAETRP